MSTIRPEITGRGSDGPPNTIAENLPTLSALDLERHVSVPDAAKFKNVSPDTFKRYYAHLIRKISPRRNAVKLRELLESESAA
jgi:hypothetical protein